MSAENTPLLNIAVLKDGMVSAASHVSSHFHFMLYTFNVLHFRGTFCVYSTTLVLRCCYVCIYVHRSFAEDFQKPVVSGGKVVALPLLAAFQSNPIHSHTPTHHICNLGQDPLAACAFCSM